MHVWCMFPEKGSSDAEAVLAVNFDGHLDLNVSRRHVSRALQRNVMLIALVENRCQQLPGASQLLTLSASEEGVAGGACSVRCSCTKAEGL